MNTYDNDMFVDEEEVNYEELYNHGVEPNPDDFDSCDFMPDEHFSNCSPWVRELEDELKKEIKRELKKCAK